MNARDDLVRALVYAFPTDGELEQRQDAARAVVEAHRLWPAIEYQYAIERALDAELQGLGAWYESLDVLKGPRVRPAGWRHPGADDLDAWHRDGIALMRSTYQRSEAVAA